jgi:large repetitive protein
VDVNTPGTYMLTYTATDGANPATPVTRTVIVVAVADLSVTSSASPSPVPAGSDLTYTITLQNAGPQPALGVSLTNALPAGTSFVSAMATSGTLTTPRGNSSTVSWSLPSLAKSGSVTLTIVVKVMAKAGTMLTNAASVSSSPKDPNLANNSASVSTAVLPRH